MLRYRLRRWVRHVALVWVRAARTATAWPASAETQAAQRELANALLHELEAHAAAEPDGGALHRSEAPTADGPQAIATTRTIPAGAIDALAAQGRFNPHQLAHLRALAATVEQHGSGALVSHFYQTEAPAGSADQSVSGRWQRHGVVGFQITPDGSVGVHAVAWEPLYKAAKTAAAAGPARLAYATSGGDIPAAITADARSYLDNAAAGRPAGEGLSAARAEFIRDFLGLPAHLTPEAGGLAALGQSSQPFLATLSLDRMNRVTPLDPVDALSGLQHDLDADSSWGELQFRPEDGLTAGASRGKTSQPKARPIDRYQIISRLKELVDIGPILALDPDARVGFRGGLARGFKGVHKGGAPFDPHDFDIDLFIASDKLASEFEGSGDRFFNAAHAGLRDFQKQLDSLLREQPEFKGLRKERVTFRIFPRNVLQEKIRSQRDVQIYFTPRH